jgi:RNA polymerase sigma-70 factor, ECF subfamily
MGPDRERALVVRAREDGGAFAELYDFYLPRIYGFVFRRVQDRCVAEDLTSMTFERALQNVRKSDFRNESFGGWLYRVASNATVDHVRRNRRLVSTSDFDDREEPGDVALDALAAALDRDQLRRALQGLPSNHREVLVLRFYDDLDVAEICAALGCSRETFAVRLHRALRALRQAVAKESEDVA